MFVICVFFFFKQKTAYGLRISDWSSDVCSSDLRDHCEIAALTRSEKGSVVLGNGAAHVIEAAKVARLVDTTGAGDLYAAGFLYGLTYIGRASCRGRVCQYE